MRCINSPALPSRLISVFLTICMCTRWLRGRLGQVCYRFMFFYFLMLTFVTREDYSQSGEVHNHFFFLVKPTIFSIPSFNYIRSVVWVSRPHCLLPKLFSNYQNATSLNISPNHLLRVFRQTVF